MRFFNKTTLADVTDANVDVFLLSDDKEARSLPLCETFLLRGRLWVDCAPSLHRKYTAPVPEDVLISRNEDCLALGRYSCAAAGNQNREEEVYCVGRHAGTLAPDEPKTI